MKRIKLFFRLLLFKFPSDSLQNACYRKSRRAWRYSRLMQDHQMITLVYCALCDGTGKVYGDGCPRCFGDGTIGMANPAIFVVKR